MSNYRIEKYRFGEIRINGKKYRKDVIILPKRVIANWRRRKGHYLQIDDLDSVFKEHPQVLIIGQGAYSRMLVPNDVSEELERRGIEFILLPTNDACEKFNQVNLEKTTAAALHLAC